MKTVRWIGNKGQEMKLTFDNITEAIAFQEKMLFVYGIEAEID